MTVQNSQRAKIDIEPDRSPATGIVEIANWPGAIGYQYIGL